MLESVDRGGHAEIVPFVLCDEQVDHITPSFVFICFLSLHCRGTLRTAYFCGILPVFTRLRNALFLKNT